MSQAGAVLLWVQALLLGSMLNLVQGTLEWITLAGGAGAAIVMIYRRVWKPVFKVAVAAHEAAPILEDLPGRLELHAEQMALLEDRVFELERQRAS